MFLISHAVEISVDYCWKIDVGLFWDTSYIVKVSRIWRQNCAARATIKLMIATFSTAFYSYLFWSDGTGSSAKIERSDLSGSNRIVLLSSTEGLVSPTTLVVDFSSQKLYWLDSAAETIGSISFDGSQPFNQTSSGLSIVSAMTVYRVRSLEFVMHHLPLIVVSLSQMPRTLWASFKSL